MNAFCLLFYDFLYKLQPKYYLNISEILIGKKIMTKWFFKLIKSNIHIFQTNCTLTLFNISNENVIISASLPQKEQEALKEAGEALLDREKVIKSLKNVKC